MEWLYAFAMKAGDFLACHSEFVEESWYQSNSQLE
jgi:hypothetical protein